MGKPGVDFPGLGVGLVILRHGRILLYKRMRPPEAGYWNIVGGKVDHMERAEEAARREAEEETGLSIGRIDRIGMTEQIIDADRQHWISILYLARDVDGEPQLTEPDKLSDFGWFPLTDLPEPLSAFTKAAIAALTTGEPAQLSARSAAS
ncbi:NUDIX domain-containing protein [Rhizobium bangladeshense]|uniref:NUDIX domain-containing protein n=1 Tax=Rhizobium bangladeshense TaxID=1138189 RepID=A0ABS7LR26_9HYPH|nr:NUDIX domain-containing protein [Rhizobium bangladeshense]MBX4867858.1 NUDIX domain-containing protein [Rhizobium bangladeshense]MBX4875147.1 NUDIX domain-containing protein [Rhizobium bangladeshense]MBX4886060.1 NUDIX domain-containing protein [Rhizobium bangladeshense]MBX4898162.1 NUDIX domain-containing protein [Rhizobium bangladeshense]MBY3593823.1 NUDIX domain-containing protein [Rhizobium bangladeshense]